MSGPMLEQLNQAILGKVSFKQLSRLFKKKKKTTNIMASGPITSWQIERGNVEAVTDFIFLGPKSLWMVTASMKLKDTCSSEGKL